MILGRLAKMALGSRNTGRLRYIRNPARGQAWGGPFNGQRGRCILMASIIAELEPKVIVETGTYLGTTTEWLAAFQHLVISVEANPEYYGFSLQRLSPWPNVELHNGDSRETLKAIIDRNVTSWSAARTLFYLDAHWNYDLPLSGEIREIYNRLHNATVVIDDFRVPHDEGYGFDVYKNGLTLSDELICDVLNDYGLALYYPALPSDRETGMKRGCVVLSRRDDHGLSGLVERNILR